MEKCFFAKKNIGFIFVLCMVCALFTACGRGTKENQTAGDESVQAGETTAAGYEWGGIDAADFENQTFKIDENGAGVIAENEDEKVKLPANYREIGSALADPTIKIYEVSESDGNKNYQIYCEQYLYQDDGKTSGLSHAVAVRRGFCKIVLIPSEIDTTESLENRYETDAGNEIYDTLVSTSGNGYAFHYAMQSAFAVCPDDEKLMAAQGFDQDLLSAIGD